MAYAFMRTMVQTRSKGHTATGAVCYRMGLASASTIPGADGLERRFDYTRRTGILATGHAAPPGTDPSWGDPLTWAHRIEAVDKRKNSRQCRDDVVGIPVELVEAGVAEKAIQAYADRLAEEHKTVVHFALHRPDRGGKNHHAHVLYPGRHVEEMTFARKRDRTQDNPEQQGDPDLVTKHKGFWSEICRGRGIELDWTSEAPGHHLGPALCAVKRARLVEETRERIRETVAASTPGEPAPGERTLQVVAETATRVNDGLTVREMLEREQQEALHGRPAPRPVPVPAPFQPEVLPARTIPDVLPARTIPDVLPARTIPDVLPARTIPDVLPPTKTIPDVLSPRLEPQVLRTVHHQAVLPPREVATRIIADRMKEQCPGQTAATWSAVERHLEQQRQTLAHEHARAAVKKRSEYARKRERAAGAPAPASRIRLIADWVLDCARQVLERLGLKPEPTPPPAPTPEPTLWERYEARWPRHAAADRAILEDLTENPIPKELLRIPGRGVDVWRRVLMGMFKADNLSRSREDPKPLPRSLAPAGEASPDAAVHAADYTGSLPSRYRSDGKQIDKRSLEAAEKVRQTLRYRRFASEERRQTLQEDAIREACGEDAQRLDREMRAERRQWQGHWDVLVRHDTLLLEEKREREDQRQRERLDEKFAKRSRTTTGRDRGEPDRTM